MTDKCPKCGREIGSRPHLNQCVLEDGLTCTYRQLAAVTAERDKLRGVVKEVRGVAEEMRARVADIHNWASEKGIDLGDPAELPYPLPELDNILSRADEGGE